MSLWIIFILPLTYKPAFFRLFTNIVVPFCFRFVLLFFVGLAIFWFWSHRRRILRNRFLMPRLLILWLRNIYFLSNLWRFCTSTHYFILTLLNVNRILFWVSLWLCANFSLLPNRIKLNHFSFKNSNLIFLRFLIWFTKATTIRVATEDGKHPIFLESNERKGFNSFLIITQAKFSIEIGTPDPNFTIICNCISILLINFDIDKFFSQLAEFSWLMVVSVHWITPNHNRTLLCNCCVVGARGNLHKFVRSININQMQWILFGTPKQ